VDVFTKQVEVPRYARMVPFEEIADPKNDYNLNLPRYIDSTEPEDLQDIEGHLRGGIPERDIDALADYWRVLPAVRATLFQAAERPGYAHLKLPITEVKSAILGHAEFTAFNAAATQLFEEWKQTNMPRLTGFGKNRHPKELIATLAEDLLNRFKTAPLLDAYDLYQHLMDYWAETMQDDCYIIAADGWVAETYRILETDKKGKTKDKGWACDLVPKPLLVARYFGTEQATIAAKQAELEAVTASLAELEEEHGVEEGFLGVLEKINKAEVNGRLKEIKGDKDAKDEAAVLKQWLKLNGEEAEYRKAIKEAEAVLDQLAYEKYPQLTAAAIKVLVVDDKWLTRLGAAVQGELDRVSQTLTGRIRQLAERYATPLPKLEDEVEELAARVAGHLQRMGFAPDLA
jgi:type I restriction enzyme M protein